MTRPLYEQPGDVARERQIIDQLRLQWRCRAHKLPRAYPLDWALGSERGLRAIVEVKRRHYDWQTLDGWGGLMLSAVKWTQAHTLARTLNVPFLLVVQIADDTLWYAKPRDARAYDGVTFTGRTDRGDPDDLEPCVLLRSPRFRRVKTRESPTVTERDLRWS